MAQRCFVLALLAAGCFVQAYAAPACSVKAAIAAARSSLKLGGTITALNLPGTLNGAPVKAGGFLYLNLPLTNGACPTTAAAVAAALKTGYVAPPAKAAGLSTVPKTPVAEVDITGLGKIANVSVNNLQGYVLGNLRANGSAVYRLVATGGSITLALDPRIVPLLAGSNGGSGAVAPFQLAGQSFAGSGCVVSAKGTVVSFDCKNLALSYKVKQAVAGQQIEATVQLTGSLFASGNTKTGAVLAAAPANPNLLRASGRRLLA